VLASDAGAKGLSVASPKPGATLSRTATFTPKLSKQLKQRTTRFELWVDSRRVARDFAAPFKAKFDTTQLADGVHSFQLRAVLGSVKRAVSARTRTLTRKVRVRISNAGAKPAAPADPLPVSREPVVDPVDPRIGAITGGDADYQLIFSDEFDGNTLDNAKWNNQRDDWLKGGVPHNNLEGAWYEPANSTVGGGVLKQTITKRSSKLVNAHGSFDYSTGMVNSNKRFAFTYGYVEARMRVPSCSGCWPAFWMLPARNAWPPEIDIFEFFDSANVKFPYFSSHWNNEAGQLQSMTNPTIDGSDLTENWHTYGLLWTEDSIQAFIDGKPGKKYTGAAVPHEDMYLIIQAAIGIGYGTPDGANLQTDYVHVYRQN
jgi:hypothetical protein